MNQDYKKHLIEHFKTLSLTLTPFLAIMPIIRHIQQQSITLDDIQISLTMYFFFLGLFFIGSSVFGYIMRLDKSQSYPSVEDSKK